MAGNWEADVVRLRVDRARFAAAALRFLGRSGWRRSGHARTGGISWRVTSRLHSSSNLQTSAPKPEHAALKSTFSRSIRSIHPT